MALLVFILLCLFVSGQGFWIDEITTACIAGAATPSSALAAMAKSGSELQMPGYMAWIWSWARVFGSSEVSLRAANIPWAALAVLSLSRILRRAGAPGWSILLALHPVVCFQMNEARPYIMTFGAAAAAFDGMDAMIATPSRREAWLCAAATAACVSASMLNLIVVPVLAAYAIARRGTRCLSRFAAEPAAAALLAVAGLAVWYAWTLRSGHGGIRSGFGLANAAMAAYEWCGFRGLGPPWHRLRSAAALSAFLPHLPNLLAGTLAWLATAALLATRRIPRGAVAALSAAATGTTLLTAAAMVARATLWGRHLMFAAPFLVVFIALAVTAPAIWERRHLPLLSRVATASLISIFLISSLLLRLSPDHGKDPFREVFEELRARRQLYDTAPIAWAAYGLAPTIYGIGGPTVTPAEGWDTARVDRWTRANPDFFLVMHRPDVCDPHHAWRNATAAAGATATWTLRGMSVYRLRLNGREADHAP